MGGRQGRRGGEGICYEFQRGACRRGAACRFSHNDDGAGRVVYQPPPAFSSESEFPSLPSEQWAVDPHSLPTPSYGVADVTGRHFGGANDGLDMLEDITAANLLEMFPDRQETLAALDRFGGDAQVSEVPPALKILANARVHPETTISARILCTVAHDHVSNEQRTPI